MRGSRSKEIRTARKEIMVGMKTTDKDTGSPAALIKGKGDKYDTITVQEFAVALYGEGTRVMIQKSA